MRKIFVAVSLELSPISGAVAETAQKPLCYYHSQLYSPGAVICITKSYWQQCDGVNWGTGKYQGMYTLVSGYAAVRLSGPAIAAN
jgi:hypothetical protein